MDNQWSLFGLDLSRLGDTARLAVDQVLWGDEAALRQRFYPTARLINAEVSQTDSYAKFIQLKGQADSSEEPPLALLLPTELGLTKIIELPIEAEADLANALFFEVSSHSPFSPEDTCAGWRLISRNAGSLRVALVIASRATVKTCVDEQLVSGNGPEESCEVWIDCEGSFVQLEGFGGGARRQVYYQQLYKHGRKLALVTLALCLLLALPAAILGARSKQLQNVLLDTESQARAAASVRTEMVELEDKVLVARQYFADRNVYDTWLNAIAAVTPDSVYLTRLGLQGDRLTISGMAENAAEYQTKLASSGLFVDLSAPAAFTRDARAGKERFTLTMQLAVER